jgi:hypothetical protein
MGFAGAFFLGSGSGAGAGAGSFGSFVVRFRVPRFFFSISGSGSTC